MICNLNLALQRHDCPCFKKVHSRQSTSIIYNSCTRTISASYNIKNSSKILHYYFLSCVLGPGVSSKLPGAYITSSNSSYGLHTLFSFSLLPAWPVFPLHLLLLCSLILSVCLSSLDMSDTIVKT